MKRDFLQEKKRQLSSVFRTAAFAVLDWLNSRYLAVLFTYLMPIDAFPWLRSCGSQQYHPIPGGEKKPSFSDKPLFLACLSCAIMSVGDAVEHVNRPTRYHIIENNYRNLHSFERNHQPPAGRPSRLFKRFCFSFLALCDAEWRLENNREAGKEPAL